jgi:peroxiredoxin Q/BCP
MNARALVPDFELPATGNQRFRLSAFRGHPLVLYFYPKNNTPGCTREGVDFRGLYPDFVKAKVDVFGVSRDSVKSHEGFKKMKNLYGRQVRGIERTALGGQGASGLE